jgi:hypothetical protein
MTRGWSRLLLIVLAAVLAASGTALAAAPSSGAGATDGGSDWGDGPTSDHGFGRIGPKAARTTTVDPAAGPDFELPFGCGQQWTGSSRAGHSPSYYSIDWNSPDDLGKPVLATAAGVVTTARSLTGSYGRYVVVDHGGGYSSLYGHLNAIVAVVGQYVDQGDLIGYLGSTGNSTGPHLHFEERLNGAYFPPYFHRATFRINSTATSANCNDRPVVGDWDGDGRTEVGVYRSTPTRSVFYQRTPAGQAVALAWGAPGDQPVVGDFDGDRLAQVGVRRQAGGTWLLRSASGAAATVPGVGTAYDAPLTGDWDGNGRAGLGFYRPSTRTFYLRSDQGTYSVVPFGRVGDRPLVGDWDGDHVTDLGLFRPSTGVWYFRVPSAGGFVVRSFVWARSTDIPVAGDWDGDGELEVGVWRPSTAQFILRSSLAATGFSAPSFTFGSRR